MIKGINSSGRYITVSGGSSSSPYISPGAVGAGMVRWNSNMSCLEVNDGLNWQTLQMNYATIELNPETEMLLNWARRKMQEEKELKLLAENNPAIKNALDAVIKAQEQLELIRDLSIEHEPN